MNNSVFKPNVDTVKWFKAALVRAGKTMAQSALGMIVADVMITELDFETIIGVALTAGLISILTSIAGIPEVPADTTNEK
jgi:hypothetical protein